MVLELIDFILLNREVTQLDRVIENLKIFENF